ncbi:MULTISPECIES: DUF3147 family protein [Neobacillus]|uniref:DUF3147 family protein n=1 Tax=Neobacillus citreus TaxID=2833578 RepID=A0A942T3F1_9BACI|nr:DUF3147 family protein [Neobacillus citreus]MCH6264377.1 DUF3147 family protein [Neobacillus citreus]
MTKDLLLRFLLGGAAVMASYLIIVVSPWEILGGIFAAFPAVMITAVLMAGVTSGTKNAAKIAGGSVYGMIGGIICAATVWLFLKLTHNWPLSMLLGLLFWLISSVMVSTLREKLNIKPFSRKMVLAEARFRHHK